MVVSERTLVLDETVVDSFTEWAREAEPHLRHALTASFGAQLGVSPSKVRTLPLMH